MCNNLTDLPFLKGELQNVVVSDICGVPIIFILPLYFFSYLIGSIPFGLLLTRLSGAGDIRKIGSGNIGATNVLRTGKKGLAALTLLLDSGKGALVVILVAIFEPHLAPWAGLAALVGHMFPVWLRFKGGKGVATAFGVMLALAWPVGVGALVVWLIVAAIFRYSSLAAIVACATTPAFAYFLGYDEGMWVVVTIAVLVVLRHTGNICRLIKGEEPKINLRKTNATPSA
jgi:acyl phosphate:glycerol-3-phosphate acyltransferase